jgi:MFS family permease
MAVSRLRWLVLALSALTIMGAYYGNDAIAPIAELLRRQRNFTQSQIGLLNAVYNLPNIPLAIVGGVLIDRIGAARAALGATVVAALGAIITAWGEPYSVMLTGRLLFGLGQETLYIALLVNLAQWFHGGGGALAVALFFSTARIGSYAADTSTSWAAGLYAQGWQPPLWLAAGFSAVGVLGAAGLLLVNRMGQAARAVPEPAERFVLADLGRFSASFWYILALNVLFASVFFPFRSTFSIQYFQDVKGISLAEAGIANSWVFAAAIFATPVFGLVADRFGRRASLLVLGAALMPVTFVLLAFTNASLWVSTALMGLSFSVIPAVIWPATAMLVDRRRIGTAYGVINMLQSAGMTVVNYLAGALNDAYAAGPGHPQGYNPMLVMFAGLSVVSLVATLALRARERRLPGGGIEAR